MHVERDEKIAKFWLDPVRLHHSGGFNPRDIGQIRRLIEDHDTELVEAGNDYFGH